MMMSVYDTDLRGASCLAREGARVSGKVAVGSARHWQGKAGLVLNRGRGASEEELEGTA